MSRSVLRACLALPVVAALMWASRVAAQDPTRHRPSLATEDALSQELRKIDHWDLMQLLRTERDVNEQQKQRARASTDPQELALLAGDEDFGVRFAVAVNPYTGTDVLLRLSGDESAAVRAGVALKLTYDVLGSPQVQETSRQIARQLTGDPQPLVRLALAGNAGLPAQTYDLLAHDADPVIRQKLAENPRVTESALRMLAVDSVQAVQLSALPQRGMPAGVLDTLSADTRSVVRVAVCGNPNASPALLTRLAEDPDLAVRRAVAAHPSTPVQALRRLARDSHVDIVVAVANHPNADRELLMGLLQDPRGASIRVAAETALVPLLRAQIREDVLERLQTP